MAVRHHIVSATLPAQAYPGSLLNQISVSIPLSDCHTMIFSEQQIAIGDQEASLLGKIHDFKAFHADDCKLVPEKMNIQGLGRYEKVFVQAEPFGPLTKEITEWAPLSDSILSITTDDRLQNTEKGVHLFDSRRQL